MSVKDTFIKLTKSTIPSGHDKMVEPLLPKGYQKDFHGNYFIKIGDSTVMFTSHCDTADSGQPKEVTHVMDGDIIKTDGKTILGADDKAGMAVMIYMIENKVPGLYYFFLSEERGCVGSRALNNYLKGAGKEDPIYKKIDKVIAFDRRDYDSVITFQVSERCCSDEFADELANRLNVAGGFKYRKDTTGSVTDSHQVAERFPECTNLSVGYKDQHSVRETQDIVFLDKLAKACCKMDWETLPVKRDPSKTEYSYSRGGTYNRGTSYYRDDWDNEAWWNKNQGAYRPTSNNAVGPKQLPKGQEYVNDYLGNKVKVSDCVWCEHDKVYCLKDEALWVDYIGFYTCPDYDPSKVKIQSLVENDVDGDFKNLKESDFVVGLKLYQKGVLFGHVSSIDAKNVIIETEKKSKFICPPDKVVSSYNSQIKNEVGNKKLGKADLAVGLNIIHPSFGKGKIISFRQDRTILKVKFAERGEKDLHIEVADMKF